MPEFCQTAKKSLDRSLSALLDWRIFLIVVISGVEIFSHFGPTYPDSTRYIAESNFFLGGLPSLFPTTSRVGTPALAAALGSFLPLRTSFAIVNSVFWLSSAILIFLIVRKLLKNSELALLGAILFTTSFPMLQNGAAVLTDSGGYFFVGLGIFFALKNDEPKTSIVYFLEGLLLGIGLLFRQEVILVVALLVVLRLWKRQGILATISGLVCPFLIGLTLVTSVFGWDGLQYFLSSFLHPVTLASGGRRFSLSEGLGSESQGIFNPLRWLLIFSYSFFPIPSILPLSWIPSIIILAAGLLFLREQKWIAAICLVVLLPTTVVGPWIGERHIFYLYPIVIPLIIGGLHNLLIFFFSHLVPRIKEKQCVYLMLSILLIMAVYNNYRIPYSLLPL